MTNRRALYIIHALPGIETGFTIGEQMHSDPPGQLIDSLRKSEKNALFVLDSAVSAAYYPARVVKSGRKWVQPRS